MSRLPYLRHEDLDEAQRRVWESVVAARGDGIISDEGGLVGPFNAWLRAPVVGLPAAQLGEAVRFHARLERDLAELAIITVGARWQAEFEWYAHSRLALRFGVDPAAVEAIGDGREPMLPGNRSVAVYRVARQLADNGQLTDEVYAAAVEELGVETLVEVVTLCGYYTMVSFVLNAFEAPLPPEVAPHWR